MTNKQLLLSVALFAACFAAEAQKTDTARMLVHYKFTWLRDTTNRAHPYTENMVLYVGQKGGRLQELRWDSIQSAV